jgi:hypothetical protein
MIWRSQPEIHNPSLRLRRYRLDLALPLRIAMSPPEIRLRDPLVGPQCLAVQLLHAEQQCFSRVRERLLRVFEGQDRLQGPGQFHG